MNQKYISKYFNYKKDKKNHISEGAVVVNGLSMEEGLTTLPPLTPINARIQDER